MKMPLTASKEYITQTRFIFHCHVKIKIPLVYGEHVLNQCFDLLHDIDKRYNSYQSGSYFDQINKSSGTWVLVDQQCIELLEVLLHVSDLTKGGFDITCMPLLRLWGFYQSFNEDIPSPKDLQECLERVNYQTILIKENYVKIAKGQEIVTGSFLKAFAVDKVIDFLKKQNITDAIINAGGSTIMGINDNTHESWTINVSDPFKDKNFYKNESISNQCFSISGRANNNLVIQGKTYGHILNPINGLPVTTRQVEVISKKAFIGDVLSTAIFALNQDQVETTIDRLKKYFEFEYYRIEDNNENI
ncbi:hypothetical protein AV926_18430 [Myroides marinus]|uniref:FAD:protein FMN transferase n=2 Tax=Myroides marinus TaxID=703342 RepID=A0A163UIB2_9FLAO|nr:hypothetical protein AV926_18430 [Myroides marinus]